MVYTLVITLKSGKKLIPLSYGTFKLVEEVFPWPPHAHRFEDPVEALRYFSRLLPPDYIPHCHVIDQYGQPAPATLR